MLNTNCIFRKQLSINDIAFLKYFFSLGIDILELSQYLIERKSMIRSCLLMMRVVKSRGIHTETFALRTEKRGDSMEDQPKWHTYLFPQISGLLTHVLNGVVQFSTGIRATRLERGDRRNTIMNHRMEKGFRRVFSRFPYFFHYTKT